MKKLLASSFVLLVSTSVLASTTIVTDRGECFDIPRKSVTAGEIVEQWTCNGGSNQAFDFVATGSGYYFIRNVNSGLCLNVNKRSLVDGGGIIQWTCGVAAQNDQFKPVANSDGTYSLIGRQSGLCLDIPGDASTNGLQIEQWTCNGGANQRFKVASGSLPAPAPTPTPSPSPTPTPTPSDTVRVLQWNVEDGEQAGEITEVVKQRPQVAFLEEVDRVGHIDDIRKALEADQGVPFYFTSVNRDGSPSGASNVAILSRYPLSNIRTKVLGYEGEVICGVSTAARATIAATITVDGKQLAVFAVRTFYDSTSCVSKTQVQRLKTFAQTYYGGLTWLFGGDFNMSAGSNAYYSMKDDAPATIDSWYDAVQAGTASAYTTPSFSTPTRGSRLDYLWFRNGPTTLEVRGALIPALTSYSDHRQMITDFNVK